MVIEDIETRLRGKKPRQAHRSLNKELSERLCEIVPNASRFLFRKSMVEHLDGIDEMLWFVPDAYRLSAEEKTVDIYEVEVTWALTDKKLRQLGELWLLLKTRGWSLRLFVVNRWLHINELDLEWVHGKYAT